MTRRREINRLLWELVDGSIAPDDRARLEGRLSVEPEDRARLAEMRALAQMLDSVEELPVPETLAVTVGRALAGKPVPGGPIAAWWPWLGELFAPRWRVRLAWSVAGLALGVGLGILAVADLRRSPVEDVSRYYGSMTGGWDRGGQGLSLTLADGSGAVTLNRDGAVLLIELAVDRQDRIPAVLEISSNKLTLNGLRTDPETSVEVVSSGDRISLTLGAVGRSWLRVGAPGPEEDGTVGIRVLAGGTALLERTIEVGKVPLS